MIRRNAPASAAAPVRTFGALAGLASPASNDLPEAEIWLNIGYETGDPDYPIVTLPFGIPVDTQKELKLTGRNEQFLAFTAARNNLLQQIQDMAKDLAPGEDIIIGGQEGGLVLQLRRKNSAVSQAPAEDTNPFMRDLFTKKVA